MATAFSISASLIFPLVMLNEKDLPLALPGSGEESFIFPALLTAKKSKWI